jgi:hypothetical protein
MSTTISRSSSISFQISCFVPKHLMSLFSFLSLHQSFSPGGRLTLWPLRNTIRLFGEELLAPRPTPKLEDHPLSAVRDCLFNIFAATLHTAGRSSIRNLRTPHAVVTGKHLSRRGFIQCCHLACDWAKRRRFHFGEICSPYI